MFDFYDYSSARFLDALADLYEKQGYAVSFLPFTYSCDFLPLLGQTTASRTVEIGADADFVATMFNAVTYDATPGDNGELIMARLLCSVVVDNNQRSLTNIPTTIQNVYGTGPRPGQLFKPLILPANSTMTVQLQNVDLGDYNVRLSHVGVKAFLAQQ